MVALESFDYRQPEYVSSEDFFLEQIYRISQGEEPIDVFNDCLKFAVKFKYFCINDKGQKTVNISRAVRFIQCFDSKSETFQIEHKLLKNGAVSSLFLTRTFNGGKTLVFALGETTFDNSLSKV